MMRRFLDGGPLSLYAIITSTLIPCPLPLPLWWNGHAICLEMHFFFCLELIETEADREMNNSWRSEERRVGKECQP